MKHTLFLTLSLLAFLATSCQKEYVLEDIDDPLPVDTTQTTSPTDSTLSGEYNGLLTKIIFYSYDEEENEIDSSVANYVYDDQNRLIEYNDYFKSIEKPTVEDYGFFIKIMRGENGIIKEIAFVTRLFETPDDNEPHYDIKYEFHYDEILSRYKYAIMTGFQEEKYQRDSIVYEYNDANKITKKTMYGYNSIGVENKKTLHITYDNNNNIIRRHTFNEYEGNESERSDISYTYDDKVAAGSFGELPTLVSEEFYNIFPAGKNNLVNAEERLNENEYAHLSYQYNAFNKPAKVTYTYENDNDKAELFYFYKK